MPPARQSRLQTLNIGLFRLLLHLYPSAYRKSYRLKMARTFSDCCRYAFVEGGVVGLVKLWIPTFLDLSATAIDKHVEDGLLSSRLTIVRVASLGAMLGSGLIFATGWSAGGGNLLLITLLFLGGALGLLTTARSTRQYMARRTNMATGEMQAWGKAGQSTIRSIRWAFYTLLGLAILAVTDVAQEISVGSSDYVQGAVQQYGPTLAFVALAGPHIVTFVVGLWLYFRGSPWAAIPALFMAAAWTLFAVQDLVEPPGGGPIASAVDAFSLAFAVAAIVTSLWTVAQFRKAKQRN